jgi:hypothetical protein
LRSLLPLAAQVSPTTALREWGLRFSRLYANLLKLRRLKRPYAASAIEPIGLVLCGSLAERCQDHAHERSEPVCLGCGCPICYPCRRSNSQPRWRCKACRGDFSITSATLFAWDKPQLRSYLFAIAAFCNDFKGKSMLVFSRELDVQHKTASVVAHKLHEAAAFGVEAPCIGGAGRVAEIAGAYFPAAMSAPQIWQLSGSIGGSPRTGPASAKSL